MVEAPPPMRKAQLRFKCKDATSSWTLLLVARTLLGSRPFKIYMILFVSLSFLSSTRTAAGCQNIYRTSLLNNLTTLSSPNCTSSSSLERPSSAPPPSERHRSRDPPGFVPAWRVNSEYLASPARRGRTPPPNGSWMAVRDLEASNPLAPRKKEGTGGGSPAMNGSD